MMHHCRHVLCLISWLMLIKWGQPLYFNLYDVFGDNVTLMYYGATAVFSCRCQDYDHDYCTNTSYSMAVMLNGTIMNSTKNHIAGVMVPIYRARIDENFQFGSYYCQMSPVFTTRSVNISSYYLCADESPSCQDSEQCCRPNPKKECAERLCIVRRLGTPSVCSKLNDSECAFHVADSAVCWGGRNGRSPNLCDALSEQTKVVFPLSTGTDRRCTGNDVHFVDELDKVLSIGSYVYYPANKNITVGCGWKVRQRPVEIVEKDIGNIILWNATMSCYTRVPFETYYADSRRRNLGKTKLIANVKSSDGYEMSSYVFIMMMAEDRLVMELDLPEGPCAPDEPVTNYSCAIKSPQLPNREFRTSVWVWFDNQELNFSEGASAISNLNISGKGTYMCKGRITHRTCNPFSQHSIDNSISVDLHDSCVPKRIQDLFKDPLMWWMLYIFSASGVFMIIFATIMIICISCICYRKWKRSRRQPIFIRMLDTTDKNNQGHVLLLATMKDLISTLTKNAFKPAKEYIGKWLGTFEKDRQEALKSHNAVQVKGARYDNVLCFVHSQVRGMHMNVLSDFRCNPLYICMAPQRPEFVRFLEAILLEKIGTIVWVGPFEEKKVTLMNPYIALIEKCSVVFQDPSRKGVKAQIRTLNILKHYKHNTYSVKAQVSGPSRKKITGYLTIIHVLEWPRIDVPTGFEALNLCDICTTIESYQQKRLSSWPGLLFHCSTGVESSAAMVALYICRQIYLERKKVNLLGVLKYIRTARFGAFVYDPDGHIQVPIILSCLLTLDKTIQEEIVIKSATVSLSRKSVFDGSTIKMSHASSRVSVFRSRHGTHDQKQSLNQSSTLTKAGRASAIAKKAVGLNRSPTLIKVSSTAKKVVSSSAKKAKGLSQPPTLTKAGLASSVAKKVKGLNQSPTLTKTGLVSSMAKKAKRSNRSPTLMKVSLVSSTAKKVKGPQPKSFKPVKLAGPKNKSTLPS